MSGSSQALWKAREIGLVAMRPDRLPNLTAPARCHCLCSQSLPLMPLTPHCGHPHPGSSISHCHLSWGTLYSGSCHVSFLGGLAQCVWSVELKSHTCDKDSRMASPRCYLGVMGLTLCEILQTCFKRNERAMNYDKCAPDFQELRGSSRQFKHMRWKQKCAGAFVVPGEKEGSPLREQESSPKQCWGCKAYFRGGRGWHWKRSPIASSEEL